METEYLGIINTYYSHSNGTLQPYLLVDNVEGVLFMLRRSLSTITLRFVKEKPKDTTKLLSEVEEWFYKQEKPYTQALVSNRHMHALPVEVLNQYNALLNTTYTVYSIHRKVKI